MYGTLGYGTLGHLGLRVLKAFTRPLLITYRLEMLEEHALSPFFVFQVFCVTLWCFDEYWYYSIFTLVMLIIFEMTVCQQRIRNLQQLRAMQRPPHPIMVYRSAKWTMVSSDQLLPGDLCSLVRSGHRHDGRYKAVAEHRRVVTGRKKQKENAVLCPCDMLLLRGSCIVNEAMLTGESVPKMKESLISAVRSDPSSAAELLSRSDGENGADSEMRPAHIVFGGTQVLQSTPAHEDGDSTTSVDRQTFPVESMPRPPDNGCVAMVIRTGFTTSQGSLMRTILFAAEPVSAANMEAFVFICVLLVFAVAAASYVLHIGLQDEKQDRWKLFLHCTMILTSVVPPELPMELSLAVTTSLARLQSLSIFCTEPYRIPFAGKVDVCCFDKTGTLTSDDLRVKGVATITGENGDGKAVKLVPARQASKEAVFVLATCHQLVYLDRQAKGDPMEKAALRSVNWSFTASGMMTPCKPTPGVNTPKLRVVHRYPFSSAARRMSVVVSLEHTRVDGGHGHPLYLLCKGAPEAIEPLLASPIPAGYRHAYHTLMRQGSRVLSLAYKPLPHDSQLSVVRGIAREEAENELLFAGFLVLDCPLKDDTPSAIGTLLRTMHRVVIITGDNVLTACNVARQLKIIGRPNSDTLVLSPSLCEGAPPCWIPVSCDSGDYDSSIEFDETDVEALVSEGRDLAVTGAGLVALQESFGGRKDAFHAALRLLVPHVLVFARVKPRQKETVVSALKAVGLTVMMCGDGTNDVGALKQADVGISIVSSPSIERAVRKSRKQQAAAAGVGQRKKRLAESALDRLQRELKAAHAAQETGALVQLGDASIASPFTSKSTSIESAINILVQGRCTLVTTIQMYKILALNCLITAYMLSALYLNGVKQGDTQMTCQGLLIAGCFMALSFSKATDSISIERPETALFCGSVLATLAGQVCVHMATLVYSLSLCADIERNEEEMAPNGEFSPNIVNSTCFIVSLILLINVFAVNYRGEPFMAGLRENKGMAYTLLGGWLFGIFLIVDPGLGVGEIFELVELPSAAFRSKLLLALVLDTALTHGVERAVRLYCCG